MLFVVAVPAVPSAVSEFAYVMEVPHEIDTLGCFTLENAVPEISFGVSASHAVGQPFVFALYGKCNVLEISLVQKAIADPLLGMINVLVPSLMVALFPVI